MKIEEMAEFLDGLGAFMDRFMGKQSVNEFRAVSDCFRQFSGETVTAFCNSVVAAKQGKTAGTRPAATTIDEAKVADLASKIRHFLDNRDTLDYSHVDVLMEALSKLKVPEIAAVGERIECHLPRKSKSAMIETLRNWLKSIKLSAHQSSFHFSAAGAGS